MEARGGTDDQIVRYAWRKSAKKPNHLTAGSLRSFPQDNRSSTASSGKANDWRNRENVVFDLFSSLKWVPSNGYFRRSSRARDLLYVGHFCGVCLVCGVCVLWHAENRRV